SVRRVLRLAHAMTTVQGSIRQIRAARPPGRADPPPRRRPSRREEAERGPPVARVEVLAVLHPLGGLQAPPQAPEPRVVQEGPEGRRPEPAAADPRMAVDAAGAPAEAVVEVPDADEAQAPDPIQLGQRLIVTLLNVQ